MCIFFFFIDTIFFINKTTIAQVKPGKTIIPEKIENTITVKPAVKKMQPALAEDPWKNKMESYSSGSSESNVTKSEASENNLNESSGKDIKTENYPPKYSRKSNRVNISKKKDIQNPIGK